MSALWQDNSILSIFPSWKNPFLLCLIACISLVALSNVLCPPELMRALQHRATAWLPKGQSAEPTDSFLGRAHLLSEQPGSPKDGLDELLARYRHQGAPGNTEHTGREIGDRTSPPALLATHRRLQARTGGAVHGREVGGLPVVPRCASHPHAPPVRPGASRRVLHPHPIPAAPVLTWWPHAHLPKDSLRAAADLLCLLGEALGSRGEV